MHTVVHCNCFVLQLAICYILPYSHLFLTPHRQELSKHSVKGGGGRGARQQGCYVVEQQWKGVASTIPPEVGQ